MTEPGQECFTFSISSPTTVGGLQVSPSEAEICISDEEGKKYNTQIKRERERERGGGECKHIMLVTVYK